MHALNIQQSRYVGNQTCKTEGLTERPTTKYDTYASIYLLNAWYLISFEYGSYSPAFGTLERYVTISN